MATRRGHGAVISKSILQVGNYKVELTRKNIKRAYLRVDPSDGTVCVNAPARMSFKDIEQFVLGHADWIEQRRLALGDTSQSTQGLGGRQGSHVLSNGDMMIWGQEKNPFEVMDLALALPDGYVRPRTKGIGPLMDASMRGILLYEATELVHMWEPRMGVSVSTVRIHDTKSRWGSCNVRTHAVNFSLALVHYPEEYLEMVVVHELTHILEPSHNARFHAIMHKYLPDCDERDARLKQLSKGLQGID